MTPRLASRRAFLGIGTNLAGLTAIRQPGRATTRSADSIGETVRNFGRPLLGASTDFDPILDLSQNASFVLIGEASHGTHEFYATRAAITQRLIEEQ